MKNIEIIKVDNLSTIFGKNIVHKDISFCINQGEIFGVLGGSGSGKTVLVKQIVMLDNIQKGNIEILGKNISNLTLKQTQDLKQQYSTLLSDLKKPQEELFESVNQYIKNQISECIFNVNLPSYYFQFDQNNGLTIIKKLKE